MKQKNLENYWKMKKKIRKIKKSNKGTKLSQLLKKMKSKKKASGPASNRKICLRIYIEREKIK